MKPLTDSSAPSSDRAEIESAALPPDWVSVIPRAGDAADLLALLHRHEVAAHGRSFTSRAAVDTQVSATGWSQR